MPELFAKSKHETRWPIKQRSLTLPGESLQTESFFLILQFAAYCVIPLGMIALALLEWIRYWFKVPPTPVYTSIVCGVVAAYCVYKLLGVWRKIDPLIMAVRGERIVGQMLETLRAKGYQVVHDLQEDGYNIDHVIVGPGGVFAVETKTRSKPAKGREVISYDGVCVRLPGGVADDAPIIQAKAAARRVREIIRQHIGREVPVRAAVIYPGWFVECMVKDAEVTVANANYFAKSFESHHSNGKQVLKPDDVAFYAAALDKYVRARE